MLTKLLLSMLGFCCCLASAGENREALDNALKLVTEELDKLPTDHTGRSLDIAIALHAQIRYRICDYLAKKSWKTRWANPHREIKEERDKEDADRSWVNLALHYNDDTILQYLLYTFDITTVNPNLEPIVEYPYDGTFGIPIYPHDTDYLLEHEPEKFVPAAMGILFHYRFRYVRYTMYEFVRDGEYDTLSPFEQHVFRRVWDIMDGELKMATECSRIRRRRKKRTQSGIGC